MTPRVELDDVERSFHGPPAVVALRRCSIRIDAGEFVAILGPSGSGKSTLLNVIGLLDRPTAGTYRLSGTDVADLSDAELSRLRATKVGFVFQDSHVLRGRTAAENVELGLVYRGERPRQRRAAAQEALAEVGLSHRADESAENLSGGERQRVAVARAMVGEPELLLCDEPTGNLDSSAAAGVLHLVEALHAKGTTVMLVTHDQRIASRCDRHVDLLDGTVSNAG